MTLTEREKLIEILSTKIHPREGIEAAALLEGLPEEDAI